MARHSEHSHGYEALKSPPSIYGGEVSAEWKRTYKGEVIMTVRMPSDTVDSEVYIKTPRGHSGIQMDPWMSQPGGRNGAPTTPPTRSPRTNLTSSTRKRPTGELVYTELLVDKSCSKSAIGHQGLTEDRTLMQTTPQSNNAS